MTFGQSGFLGYGFCTPRPDNGRDVLDHACLSTASTPRLPRDGPGALRRHLQNVSCPAGITRPAKRRGDGRDHCQPSTLDVATPADMVASYNALIGDSAHAQAPMRPWRLARARRRHALACLPARVKNQRETFERNRARALPRATDVSVARRNGINKREYGRAVAWVRDLLA